MFIRFSTVTDVPNDGIVVTCIRVDMLTELILDVDPGVLIDVAIDMLPDIGIIAMDTPAITLEFVVKLSCAGDVLTDVSAVPTTDVAPGTDVDILNNENVNGLAAVMTPLELTLSSS